MLDRGTKPSNASPSRGDGDAAAGRPAALDPVLLEIMRHKVEAIADEICLTLLRTCRSVFVNEAADFAVGLIDLEGQIFGWAPENKTTSVNVPAAYTLEAMGTLEPGDAIVTNDPYTTEAMATHLPDLHVIRPYFHGPRLVGYGWGFIHYMDVGGRFPGSMSPHTADIFQEGFRIPPMKLMRKGVLNEDFIHLFKANCRLPETNMADLKAMLGALEVGGLRVRDTIDRYGVETFVASQAALKDYAAEKARDVLRLLPDGTYDFWDYLDDDVVSAIPIRMRLRATVDDGRVHFDVTGTDPQVEASYNIPTAGKLHNMLTRRIMTFICTHDRTIPLNAGTFRPLSMTSPAGTVLNAEFPDACAVRFSTATGFNDAVSGVLLKAAPDKMAGATAGASFTIVVEETNPADGRREVIFAQLARGGMSAFGGSDGVDVRDVTMNTMHNHPLEVVEAKCGVAFRGLRRAPGLGGAGPVAGRRGAGAHRRGPPGPHHPGHRRPRSHPLSSVGSAGRAARPTDGGDREPGPARGAPAREREFAHPRPRRDGDHAHPGRLRLRGPLRARPGGGAARRGARLRLARWRAPGLRGGVDGRAGGRRRGDPHRAREPDPAERRDRFSTSAPSGSRGNGSLTTPPCRPSTGASSSFRRRSGSRCAGVSSRRRYRTFPGPGTAGWTKCWPMRMRCASA